MSLLASLSLLPDPLICRCRRHRLCDVLFIALCASICGADSFVAMERWATAKKEWLIERLCLPAESRLPSHDTFGRVFARLDSNAFAACFADWTKTLHRQTQGEVIALDGKQLRRSFDTATGKAALYLVWPFSAFAETRSSRNR